MTTTFALLCQRCGLSHREAADFLRVRLDTVKSWSSGRNATPPGAIDELRGLARRIERAAAESVKIVARQTKARGAPADIELGIASDDHEARDLGWPCVGAHAAVLAAIAAAIDHPVRIVPRGSTMATAAAIQAREGRS